MVPQAGCPGACRPLNVDGRTPVVDLSTPRQKVETPGQACDLHSAAVSDGPQTRRVATGLHVSNVLSLTNHLEVVSG